MTRKWIIKDDVRDMQIVMLTDNEGIVTLSISDGENKTKTMATLNDLQLARLVSSAIKCYNQRNGIEND